LQVQLVPCLVLGLETSSLVIKTTKTIEKLVTNLRQLIQKAIVALTSQNQVLLATREEVVSLVTNQKHHQAHQVAAVHTVDR